jgi:tetratricopeptide (TPR) repeat protein
MKGISEEEILKRQILAVGILAFLLSCASIPGAEKPDDGLVVGTLKLDFPDGFKPDGARTFRANIQIKITDVTKGNSFNVLTSSDGHFVFLSNSSDTYAIDDIKLLGERYPFEHRLHHIFTVRPKAILFMGDITFIYSKPRYVYEGGGHYVYNNSFDQKYVSSPKDYLSNVDPKSQWLSYEVETSQLPPPLKPQPLEEQPSKEQTPQRPEASLELKLFFDDIYPVFYTFYDTHPLGEVVLSNTSGQSITDITVNFQIKEFMANPHDCPAPSELPSGESASVDLFGLFLPTILETTERTKAQAEVNVGYTLGGQVLHQSLVQSIPILDRNATTWVDDRRAAAFVTTKDPTVLTFSKRVSSMTEGIIKAEISSNLLVAIAFFEALQLYGLKYSQDPISTFTANKQVADYIQFPRQTLQYKGGKCSDFSILYSALLESVGIETAFITIPGHIFVAFSTGVSPDDAKKTFSRANDLIFLGDKSWIPVEVTESGEFLRAWQDGAKEWRENTSNNQAAFYPLHDAWQVYEPVGLPGAEVTVELPPSDKIVTAYQEEVAKFIDQEISPKVVSLENQITKAPDPRKPTNALGVLYARYGQYDQARKEFEKLLAKEEYVPALLNMGNILYLSDQEVKALDYYNRALSKDPENPRILLAVARANQDLQNYSAVKKVYAELKAKDPDLAKQFAYLDLKGEDVTREANAAALNVLWEE